MNKISKHLLRSMKNQIFILIGLLAGVQIAIYHYLIVTIAVKEKLQICKTLPRQISFAYFFFI